LRAGALFTVLPSPDPPCRPPPVILFDAVSRAHPARFEPNLSTNVQNPVKVKPLLNRADFLIHRVVLQNRVSGDPTAPRPMFHVKHLCVKSPPAHLLPAASESLY
jgi:hypothetical protein